MSVREDLARSIYTGFVDNSEISLAEYHPKLLINNSKRGQKVLTCITNELNKCDEFLFSVAFVTNSGVASLINALEELENKGIKGKIIASQYQNFTEPRALERLIQLKNLEVRIVVENNFHAKSYIFRKNDTYTLIVGSSNLTQDALSHNKEWNIKVSSMDEGSLIKETITEFENTFNNAEVVDEAWIKEYEKIYRSPYFSNNFSADTTDKQKWNGEEFNTEISTEFVYTQNHNNSILNDGSANEAEYSTGKTPKAYTQYNIPSIHRILPNKMQIEALRSLEALRKKSKGKALLISATGTGKTYLSAFDVKKFDPNRFLFIVHRENIARAALRSFQKVLGYDVGMGILSGNRKDYNAKYIFSTIQTISKDDVLLSFSPDNFDYIVIDDSVHIPLN